MRNVQEVLGLHHERKCSQRQIQASTGLSKGAVSDYLRRARDAGMTWEIARELTDAEVEARLFKTFGVREPPGRVAIDFEWVHRELRRTGVTLHSARATSPFAEASYTQTSADFIVSTIRALEYFDAVPEILVPDQLRSAVTGPDRYDPEINPAYLEMAQHYGVAVIPARARKPRDKAKVAAGVLIAQRWILARLRNRTFFSLAELNAAIAELLEDLNTRPFRKLDRYDHSSTVSMGLPFVCCAYSGVP